MGIALDEAFAFVAQHRQGVLVTIRGDGRPQLSNVLYLASPDHSVRISVTDARAKTKNLRRDPRASLHVTRDDFFAYVVLDGGYSGSNFQSVNPQKVIYLGSSLVGKPLSGANIPRVTGNPTIGSQPINYFNFTPNPANSALSPTNPAYYNGWAGQQTLTVTNSEADI